MRNIYPQSIRLISTQGRRLWYSHSSNSMLVITGYMRKAQPAPCLACRAFTWATLSSTLASLLVGLKLFCPWCLKLGGNTEMITIHLCEVHCWMAIACDICQAFASMTAQNIKTISQSINGSVTKSMQSAMPMKCMENPRFTGTKVSQVKKSIQIKNHAEQNATLCFPPFLLTPSCLATPVYECSFYL